MPGLTPETLEWIKDAQKPEEMIIGGRTYTTREVHEVNAPESKPILITTLTGLIDYVKGGDGFDDPKNVHVRIMSPYEVRLESRIFGDFRQRETLMKVEAVLPVISIIDRYSYQDHFITQLQACFVDRGDFGVVASYAKNVTSTSESTHTDDGVTQAVVYRENSSNKEVVALPNPVTLFPRRTFTEVEQPETRMVFRVGKDDNKVPTFMLVEADGGAWRNKAIASVAAYLRENLPGVLVIS